MCCIYLWFICGSLFNFLYVLACRVLDRVYKDMRPKNGIVCFGLQPIQHLSASASKCDQIHEPFKDFYLFRNNFSKKVYALKCM